MLKEIVGVALLPNQRSLSGHRLGDVRGESYLCPSADEWRGEVKMSWNGMRVAFLSSHHLTMFPPLDARVGPLMMFPYVRALANLFHTARPRTF